MRWAALAVVLVLGLAGAATAIPAGAASVTFQDTDEALMNPERGFYMQQDGLPGALPDARSQGLTVVRGLFRLDPHRGSPTLPESYLSAVGATFDQARAMGLKLVVRFAYNYEAGGADAPLDVVLAHIDQLGPVLREHRDVILVIESGFVGAWGEWHSSTNGLDTRAAKERILRRQLARFPPEVKLALRLPRDKRALLGTTPISGDEAHSGRPRARVGFHNDCVLANETEGGTWEDGEGGRSDAAREYVDRETAHVPMGGETCLLDEIRPDLSNCDNARSVLAEQGWTVLNGGYYDGVLDLWRSGGCYDEIARRLGYRFALAKAEVPDRVTAGTQLGLRVEVRNDGFTAPYNARPVEVVLRHQTTGALTTIPTDADPRFWGAGQTSTVTVNASIPNNAPAGPHDVLLRLPDPSPRLRDRPEFAVGFANAGVWDQSTGLNALNLTTDVAASAPAAAVDAVVDGLEALLDRVAGQG
jgi:hypothetical protein